MTDVEKKSLDKAYESTLKKIGEVRLYNDEHMLKYKKQCIEVAEKHIEHMKFILKLASS